MRDKVSKNRQVKGTAIQTCKPDEGRVVDMRYTASLGLYSQTELAEQYGITQGHVSAILRGSSWKQVGTATV